MKRRLLAWILCVVMMVMAMPMTAFAQTENGVAQVSSWEEFMEALADENASTISLSAGITSPQGAGDDAVFLNRSVTILGNGNTMSLNAGGLILGGDVTLKNMAISFNNVVRNAIIANGYTLTLSDVRNGSGATSIHVFAGGITDYNGDNVTELPEAGSYGRIVIQGECQLGNLYAGSLSDGAKESEAYSNTFEGDVTITFDDSAADCSVGGIYACGARESRGEAKPDVFYHNADKYKVTGSVLIDLCNNNVASVDGTTGGTTNAAVSFADAEDKMYTKAITVANLSVLSVEKGYLEVSADSSLKAGTTLALSGGARLSLMKLGEAISVGSFMGSTIADLPGEMELKAAQTLSINGVVSGQTSVGIGGIAFPALPEEGRTYISAPFATGLTGEEFVFVDYGGMSEYTPIFASGNNAWIAPGVDYTVVISEISVDAKTVVSAENTGVEIPITVSYSQRPYEETGLAYVPVTFWVNGEKAIRDGSDEFGYMYTSGDLEFYVDYIEEVKEYEDLCIEGAGFTVPEGTYQFEMEISAENMADGQAETLFFTLVVGEEEILLQPIEVPAANTNLSYTGGEQIGVSEGEGYTLTGHRETNAGSYTAVATLKEGYKWSDETTAPKNISWKIEQAFGEGSVSLKSWREGEQAKTPNTTSATNGGSVSFLYKLQEADDSTYTDFAVSPTEAGNYTLKAIFASTQNYKEVVAYGNFSVFHALEHVEAKEATCEDAGNTEHWYCTVCEKYYSDADGTQETTEKALEIPATDHDWGPWTEVNDETHKRICKNDENHTEAEEHIYTDGTCVCGHEEEVESGVEAFVKRLYRVCLEREADAASFEYWVNVLNEGTRTGEQAARGFVFSPEFTSKNYDNPTYVEYLYRACMGREADENGKQGWVNALEGGMTREEVFEHFILSSEFGNLCKEYGIVAAYTEEQLVTNFVERMYSVVLARNAVESEVEGWVDALLNWRIDGATLAYGFINSDEFKDKNVSDSEYLDVLYLAIMNREADEEGKNGWMNGLAGGMTREEVMNSFVTAPEFTNLCKENGILAVITQEDLVRGFVERLYTLVLGREAAEEEVQGWSQGLLNQSVYGAKVAYDFIDSQEFAAKNVDDESYIEVLYKALFNRVPCEEDKAAWVNNLKNGMTRREALINFLNSEEFETVCENYGILRGDVQ